MPRFTLRDLFWLTLGSIACLAIPCDARPRRIWTYKDLTKEAELVCIASVTATRLRKNETLNPDFLDEFESDLKIRTVFKGDVKLEKATFIFYRYRPNAGGIGNGPNLADLPTPDEVKAAIAAKAAGKPVPAFLLFCKRRKDGHFGPVTGDTDAALSVYRLNGSADDEH